jgi:Fe-S-cluster-containing hydrogenase component 2
MVRWGVPMMAPSGFVAEVDPQRCRGCGKCQQVCAFRAVEVHGRAQVDVDRSLGLRTDWQSVAQRCAHGARPAD